MTWLSRLLPTRAPGRAAAAELVRNWLTAAEANMDRSHYESRYVVVNTEASTLNRNSARMLAVAAIGVEHGVIDPVDSYYRQLGDDPAPALAGLLEFAGHQPVVMFNAGFHCLLLESAFSSQFGITPAWRFTDLYFLLPALFPERFEQEVRMADWMRTFGIETFQRHHALGDAWAIAQLFLAAQARALGRGATSPNALMEFEQTHRHYRRRS